MYKSKLININSNKYIKRNNVKSDQDFYTWIESKLIGDESLISQSSDTYIYKIPPNVADINRYYDISCLPDPDLIWDWCINIKADVNILYDYTNHDFYINNSLDNKITISQQLQQVPFNFIRNNTENTLFKLCKVQYKWYHKYTKQPIIDPSNPNNIDNVIIQDFKVDNSQKIYLYKQTDSSSNYKSISYITTCTDDTSDTKIFPLPIEGVNRVYDLVHTSNTNNSFINNTQVVNRSDEQLGSIEVSGITEPSASNGIYNLTAHPYDNYIVYKHQSHIRVLYYDRNTQIWKLEDSTFVVHFTSNVSTTDITDPNIEWTSANGSSGNIKINANLAVESQNLLNYFTKGMLLQEYINYIPNTTTISSRIYILIGDVLNKVQVPTNPVPCWDGIQTNQPLTDICNGTYKFIKDDNITNWPFGYWKDRDNTINIQNVNDQYFYIVKQNNISIIQSEIFNQQLYPWNCTNWSFVQQIGILGTVTSLKNDIVESKLEETYSPNYDINYNDNRWVMYDDNKLYLINSSDYYLNQKLDFDLFVHDQKIIQQLINNIDQTTAKYTITNSNITETYQETDTTIYDIIIDRYNSYSIPSLVDFLINNPNKDIEDYIQ